MKLPWDVKEFDWANATAYLRRFNLMAADCGLRGTAKLNRFSAYCGISIISEVESLAGDPKQKEYQISYLHSLAEHQQRKGAQDLKAYAIQFKKIAKMLIREGKLSGYGACAEFYGGLPEVVQEHIQRRLNIDWTNPGALNVDNIIQEVIDLEDGKLGRQRFLHSTHSGPSTSAPEPETHVMPPEEIRSAPVPEEKSQQIDRLTALMDQMSLSMVEMDKKHAQLDNLIATVRQMRLGLSRQKDFKQDEAKK